jgi:hypothetical protein
VYGSKVVHSRHFRQVELIQPLLDCCNELRGVIIHDHNEVTGDSISLRDLSVEDIYYLCRLYSDTNVSKAKWVTASMPLRRTRATDRWFNINSSPADYLPGFPDLAKTFGYTSDCVSSLALSYLPRPATPRNWKCDDPLSSKKNMKHEEVVNALLLMLNALRRAIHSTADSGFTLCNITREHIRDIAGVYRPDYPYVRFGGKPKPDYTDWQTLVYLTMPLNRKSALVRWFGFCY